MANEEYQIPIFLINGQLDSGKTRFISDTIAMGQFADAKNKLLIVLENGALYSADKKTMIYCSIQGDETEFIIPEGVTLICKHTFFLCDRFIKITLPSTLSRVITESGISTTPIAFHAGQQTIFVMSLL